MKLTTIKEFLDKKKELKMMCIEDTTLLNCINFCEAVCYLDTRFYIILVNDIVYIYEMDENKNLTVVTTKDYLTYLIDELEKYKGVKVTSINLCEGYITVLHALKDINYFLDN